VGSKHSTLEIGASGCQKNVVRVPIQAQSGRSYLFLYVLGDPKTLVLLIVAHADAPVTAADCEFFLFYFQKKRFTASKLLNRFLESILKVSLLKKKLAR
jgi:hypothetical protein